jgi:hypothetical protein
MRDDVPHSRPRHVPTCRRCRVAHAEPAPVPLAQVVGALAWDAWIRNCCAAVSTFARRTADQWVERNLPATTGAIPISTPPSGTVLDGPGPGP